MNIYHQNLAIPVPFSPKEMNMTDNVLGLYRSRFLKNQINEEFLTWLYSLNLDLEEGRILHMKTDRYTNYTIHTDSPNDSINRVNINMIYDSIDSDMIWYECEKNSESFSQDGRLRYYNNGEKIYETKCNTHCLVNTGIPHRVINSQYQTKPRHCFILCLIHKDTKERMSFQQAENILAPYIIK